MKGNKAAMVQATRGRAESGEGGPIAGARTVHKIDEPVVTTYLGGGSDSASLRNC